MNRGFKETLLALGLFLLASASMLGIVTLLTGCAPKLVAEYEHHSSAVDYFDRNVSDMLGACLSVRLGDRCGDYCPEADACLHWELKSQPVFGRAPVGTVRMRQPVVVFGEIERPFIFRREDLP